MDETFGRATSFRQSCGRGVSIRGTQLRTSRPTTTPFWCTHAILVAACSGSSGGHPTTSVSSPTRAATSPQTATPSTSVSSRPSSPAVPTTGPNVRPGERPPVLAAVGKTNTPRGAEVFARYWFAALDWGYATTSSALARQIYLPSCTHCERFMKNFDEPRSKNEHVRGGRLSVISTALVTDDQRFKADAVWDVIVQATQLQTISAGGTVVATAPSVTNYPYRLWLVWSDSSWHVAESKHVVYR